MDVKRVTTLINEAIAANDNLFLIDYSISNGGDIEVIVDGNKGVPLDECIRISRHIEHNLDREVDDFSLKVTTPDITKPLVHPKQYEKNIGRILKVQTLEEKFEGILVDILDNKLILEWKAREPKPIGKGKHTVEKKAEIAIENITKARVKIVYN
jgi:ribosome maturation factor RimP